MKKNDLAAAEQSLSSAMLGLLLIDPKQSYSICKVLVGLIEAHIQAHDIYTAFQLATISEQFINRSLNSASVLFSQYKFQQAFLMSYTNAYSRAAAALIEASDRTARLDIAEEVKIYRMTSANGMASAALALENKIPQSKEVHARHPMRSHKDAILKQGEFQNYSQSSTLRFRTYL